MIDLTPFETADGCSWRLPYIEQDELAVAQPEDFISKLATLNQHGWRSYTIPNMLQILAWAIALLSEIEDKPVEPKHQRNLFKSVGRNALC